MSVYQVMYSRGKAPRDYNEIDKPSCIHVFTSRVAILHGLTTVLPSGPPTGGIRKWMVAMKLEWLSKTCWG